MAEKTSTLWDPDFKFTYETDSEEEYANGGKPIGSKPIPIVDNSNYVIRGNIHVDNYNFPRWNFPSHCDRSSFIDQMIKEGDFSPNK